MASNYQHETPVVPRKWSDEERRYAMQVDELFEQLYMTLGLLKQRVKALEMAARKREKEG